MGVRSTADALVLAREIDLDLVEVAPLANPPVCRIMDYGKFRYEEAQKAKESRKKTTHVTIKEVKFRPKIGKGDFDTKVRHMHVFLQDGHKVKVTLQFRGREMAHPELGSRILDAVIEQLADVAKVDTQARLDGRTMTLVLSPDKKPTKKSANKDPKKSTEQKAPANVDAVTSNTDELVTESQVNAKDEDQQDSGEAIQENGNGQVAPPAREPTTPV